MCCISDYSYLQSKSKPRLARVETKGITVLLKEF